MGVSSDAKETGWEEQHDRLRKLAEQAGFLILDLADVYAGHPLPSLWLGDWDRHPNAEGHRLIADKLYTAILENRALFSLSLQAGAAAGREGNS